METIKILFVDIDGTLTITKSGRPFKQSPDDIKPIEGTQQAIKHFYNRGYKIFGISNQGGCDTINPSTDKPFKTVDDAVLEMHNTLTLFPEINSIFICPSMNGDMCIAINSRRDDKSKPLVITNIKSCLWQGLYRKPSIGMISEIQCLYDGLGILNNEESLVVGDRFEDSECAKNAGIPFMAADVWRNKYGKREYRK